MRPFLYVLLFFTAIGCAIVWQIFRRMSAGTQAFLNPEGYAIQKVVEMQPVLPLDPQPALSDGFPRDRWNALAKYDPEIAPAVEQLRPFGDKWVLAFGRDFFALQEDRTYLRHITTKLLAEAQQEADRNAAIEVERKEAERRSRFRKLYNGETCSNESVTILSEAEKQGYILSTDASGTINAFLPGRGTSYLRSNSDIMFFKQWLK